MFTKPKSCADISIHDEVYLTGVVIAKTLGRYLKIKLSSGAIVDLKPDEIVGYKARMPKTVSEFRMLNCAQQDEIIKKWLDKEKEPEITWDKGDKIVVHATVVNKPDEHGYCEVVFENTDATAFMPAKFFTSALIT